MNATHLDEEAIFHVARRIGDREARDAYLHQVCGGDAALRGRVERLLKVGEQESCFLEKAACDATVDLPAPAEGPGTSVGPYKVLEAIGEGGMGTVYVAEQTHPVRRKVALKVIKPGMDTGQVVARFEAERQALALMDHPNIARVLDGGATEAGRPYFVMELVRGIPITDYCDREQLTVAERLELFVLVCRAVQHAHQKGVIHRDLKPSNILVTVVDGAAVPKVIDFGVAKATGARLTERTLFTGFHQMVGTPLYMSPEQADLAGVDVDTRSDVYALGVLLYELLTGSTPFDRATFDRAAFDEMRRIIREEEPPRPSTRVSTPGATLTKVSANRKADPRRLNRLVRGELDWVVMRALEKDRRRRYETANDFAADVMRHLTDRPVEACPPSARYRFGKFARRNRVVLTTTALVATALVAGAALSLWQAGRAARAAAEAGRRTEELRQVVDYLVTDVFAAAAPGKGRGRSVTVGELLDQADSAVGDGFRGRPLVEASVRMALARACLLQFDLDRAESHAVRAAEIRAPLLGVEHPETLQALQVRATILAYQGLGSSSKGEAGVALGRRVLAARRRVLGPDHPDVVETGTFLALGLFVLGRQDEALSEATKAESLALRVLGPDHASTFWATDTLGLVVAARGDRERGEALLRRALAGRERLLGAMHLDTMFSLIHVGDVLRAQGRLDEALPLCLETVGRFERYFGATHLNVSCPLGNLFSVLRRRGDWAALRDFCEGWSRELLATPPPPDEFERSRRLIRLGSLAFQLATLPGDVPFDADLAARVAEETRGSFAPGLIFCRLGRLEEAEEAIRPVVQRGGGDSWDWMTVALIRARRNEHRQAREWYDRAMKRFAKGNVPSYPDPFEALRAEVAALLGVERPQAEVKSKPALESTPPSG